MAESSKKRNGSFKKFLPSFFSKSKNKSKDTNLKVSNNVSKSNQYHDPRSVIRSDKSESDDNNRVYENLTTKRQNDNEIQSLDISDNYSSSSTLVSESVRNKKQHSFSAGDQRIKYHSARPQVPPKPYCEMHTSNIHATYPDVYYHSLEKLTDKISPRDEIEIYKASQVQANPASVGAEIKRVSTKFLISPKKESEVRTIQPTRARSLSFDRSKENEGISQTNPKKNVKKAYNYSAPTSPIPINHKIPTMPKTASPYEHVRKHMIETEEKRNNSLSRGSLRKTTPSPGLEYIQPQRCTSVPSHSPIYKDSSLEKEKTLQKVEAFYWQKLKEMKEKEDEYLRQASLRSSFGINVHPQSNCSSPIPLRVKPRSFSLPRGVELQSYSNQPLYATPFVRGTQERRTDTFVKTHSPITDPEIIYRHPEKLFATPSSQPLQKTPIFHRGSLNRQTSIASQPKRVSFEEQYSKPERVVKTVVSRATKVTDDIPKPVNQANECSKNMKVSEMSRGPPRPPMRTTSVGSKTFKLVNNSRIIYSAGTGHSLYSESESGSEAGEIQRILQSNTRKGKQYCIIYKRLIQFLLKANLLCPFLSRSTIKLLYLLKISIKFVLRKVLLGNIKCCLISYFSVIQYCSEKTYMHDFLGVF